LSPPWVVDRSLGVASDDKGLCEDGDSDGRWLVTMEGHIRSMATIDDFKGHQRRQWTMANHNGGSSKTVANGGRLQEKWSPETIADNGQWGRQTMGGDSNKRWLVMVERHWRWQRTMANDSRGQSNMVIGSKLRQTMAEGWWCQPVVNYWLG
jgi:hypothetical protein